MSIRWVERYADRTRRMTGSAIREILKVTERPEVISFAGGMPAPEMFPVEEIAAVSERVLRESGRAALQYSATEGYRPLREYLAAQLRAEGVPVTVDNVLITTGSQQGLDLVGKILLDRGDRVAVESPTYLAALQSWASYEARFVPVPSDADGMDVEAVTAQNERPVLIYTVPTFQNPRGVTLSLARRERLIDLARRENFAVLEDDPYHDLRFAGAHLPQLIALDAARGGETPYAGNVISLGSTSKVLAPGLRTGWVVAAPEVIAQLTLAKQGTDLHTSTFDQMIVYEMLRSGYVARHTEDLIRTYRHRRDVMLHALAEHFPDGVRWTDPEGGMFLWVELPETVESVELLRAAMTANVAFVPGSGFHADGRGHNTLRLNFSNSTPERIEEGIARLRRAYDACTRSPREVGARHSQARALEAGGQAR